MGDLVTGLSICFSLLFLLGGLISLYLLRKEVAKDVIKGLVNIYIIVFGLCFIWQIIFTFLPPIVFSGLVFVFLIFVRLTFLNEKFRRSTHRVYRSLL